MIPFIDLKLQYRGIKNEIDEAILSVLESTQFVLGKEVDLFEREFAEYCGSKHAVAVNSGTSALHLALLAAGIGDGDEVITVSFTFVATTAAILYTGARPVFVDIDPLRYTMDVSQIERKITKKTKAILPVHIHGQPADMDPILDIAKRHGLVVIEDAAQSHGAEYKGLKAGSMGDMGCFSFYPGKNLGAYGEGGIVVTNNAAYERKMRMLRDWGQEQKYHHVLRGFNYRMEGIQGAVLRVKLKYLDEWTGLRIANANTYKKLLDKTEYITPPIIPDTKHVYHVYAIRAADRDALQKHLQSHDIQTNIHYPIPVHLQKAYATDECREGDLPVTEIVSKQTISLPMYPELLYEQQREVVDTILSFSGGMQ